MITAASFRRDFPEFADTSKFPNSTVQYYLNFATRLLNVDRWGAPATTDAQADYTEWDFGAGLFIAHNVALEGKTLAEANNGALPGQVTGPVNNKSIDKVSIGYDTQAVIELDAGHWNMTIYGIRFIKLARMMGAGPVQVGANPVIDPLSAQNAFQGPWPSNFPNPSG